MKNNYLSYKVKLIKASNGEGITILPYIKKYFGYLKFGDAIRTIMNNTHYKDYFTTELFPQNTNNIITYDYIPLSINEHDINGTAIINEIKCFLSLFNNYKNLLILFSQYRRDYERHLIYGNYDTSCKALEHIENSFGYSFWLIESKLLLSNYAMNVIETEKYYQNLKVQCSDYYIKNFIRSLRRKTNTNENVKDSISFIEKKQKDFASTTKHIELYKQIYFEFYNNSINTLSYTMAYSLLHMATRLNLIDMFLLIEKIIVQIICSDSFSYENKERLLSVLYEYQLPFVFEKTCNMLNNYIDFNDPLTKIIYDSKRKLYNTKLNCKQQYWEKAIKEFPTSFDMIISYAQMEIVYSQSNNFDSTLLKHLIDIIKISILKEGNHKVFSSVTNDAIRLKMILSSTTLNYSYSNFYYDTFCADTSQVMEAIFTSDYYNRHIYYYIKPNRDNIEIFNNFFGIYECNWYHNVKKDENLLYDEISESLFKIDSNEIDLEALYFQNEKVSSPLSIIANNRCCEKLFEFYVQSNQIQKAIDLYVDLQFKSKLKVCSYNNEILNKKLNGITLPALYNNLNFCIYSHLTDFRGVQGLRYNHQSANSLMKILKVQKVIFPSQLTLDSNASILLRLKYTYLFRHVCKTELLLSRLVANGINTEDIVEQTRLALDERKKLLYRAMHLETDEEEKKEITYQIKTIEADIDSLGNISLEDTLISYAKILESAVCVSDTEVILPFYNGFNRIIMQKQTYDFNDFMSGEFLIFRDLFVKYKIEYIKSLDQQIGINIRHGFLKNEILSYFSKYCIAFDKFPSKEEEIPKFINDMIIKLKNQPEYSYLILYIEEIICFSKKLYEFIDKLLTKITISHISSFTQDISKVYIEDEQISKIAYCLLDTHNSYEFKAKLNTLMGEVLENFLKAIGEYIEKSISIGCTELIDSVFNDIVNDNEELSNNITCVKSNLFKLSHKIKKWFEYIKDGNKVCSLDKYFSLLQKKFNFINYNLSDELPDEIKFYQLHCLDLVLSNLIMNAEEHSGLRENELIINTSVSIDKNIMKIYFSNNLHNNKKKRELLKKIEELEYNLKNRHKNNSKSKGNGFYHIMESLDSLNGTKWELSFCKKELPKYFSLIIEIDWRDYVA